MVGTELWFPLWNKSQLDSAVKIIAEKIENYAKLVDNTPLSPQSPISLIPSSSSFVTVSSASTKRELFRNCCAMKGMMMLISQPLLNISKRISHCVPLHLMFFLQGTM
jgi:hypothetical protein